MTTATLAAEHMRSVEEGAAFQPSHTNLAQTIVPCTNVSGPVFYFNLPSVRQALHVDDRAHGWDVCSTYVNYTQYASSVRDIYLSVKDELDIVRWKELIGPVFFLSLDEYDRLTCGDVVSCLCVVVNAQTAPAFATITAVVTLWCSSHYHPCLCVACLCHISNMQLVYSGDVDSCVPYLGTEAAMDSLQFPVSVGAVLVICHPQRGS